MYLSLSGMAFLTYLLTLPDKHYFTLSFLFLTHIRSLTPSSFLSCLLHYNLHNKITHIFLAYQCMCLLTCGKSRLVKDDSMFGPTDCKRQNLISVTHLLTLKPDLLSPTLKVPPTTNIKKEIVRVSEILFKKSSSFFY